MFFLRWFLKITFSDKHFLRAGQQQQQSLSNSLLTSLNVETVWIKNKFKKIFLNKKNEKVEDVIWNSLD